MTHPAAPVPALLHAPTPATKRWRQRLTASLCSIALLLPATLPPAYAQVRLPALGDPAGEDFDLGTEQKVGQQIMREIRADPDYLDDPVLLEYVQSLWQPLLAQARIRGNLTPDIDQRFPWEPFLIRDKVVNAFALPGGYIGVYLGLIAITTTRDELASVLAHEMSHITQRHIARNIASSRHQSLIGLAALLLGVLAASKGAGPDATQAAVIGGQAVAAQGSLNFSRDMEREADRVGFAVMTGAGFSPGGMAAMFERLEQSSRLNDSGGFPYLRTHPLNAERIGEARGRMGTTPPSPPISVLEHTLAQARARVMMDPRVDALRRWQALDTDRISTTVADKLAHAYESALASTMLRDFARADASLATALALVRSAEQTATVPGTARAERAVALLVVQSMLARGDVVNAMTALRPYLNEGSRPVLMLATQAALVAAPAAAPNDAALKLRASDLQTWVVEHPNDALAWAMLTQVWARLGQALRAVRADAESHVAVGDLAGALDRLRGAQRPAAGSSDFIDASIIDSRLRTIEAQRRQQLADERNER